MVCTQYFLKAPLATLSLPPSVILQPYASCPLHRCNPHLPHCDHNPFTLIFSRQLFKALKPHQNIIFEIKNIKASLREIKDRGERYGFNSLEEGSSSKSSVTSIEYHDPRLNSLFVTDNEFLDVNFPSDKLIACLVEGALARMMISFVGTGGIGKTTLVKKVYDVEVVKGHFDCCAWITVSQSYNIEKLLRILAQQISSTIERVAGEVDIIEYLINPLRQHLQTKRYLVVFDDVWQTDFWCVMKHALPINDKGSRIIITTRNDTIADSCKETSSDLVIKLQPWSQEMAWELFCKKAFKYEFERTCPKELEELSMQIVKKCQGLPLVIATVAGLLSLKEKSAFEWKKMHDALCSELETNPHLSNISKILSLSYNNLPYYLKSCFLYFAIFPEDRFIADVRLYRYWIGEGFVKEKRGKTLEQVAEEYLNELIQRNLVQVWGLLGYSDKLCRVHDLVHDVILSRANELGFCQILDENKSMISGKSRRLSIHTSNKNAMETIEDYGARSIFLFNVDGLTKAFMLTWFEKFKKFQLLKVLDFTDVPLEYLPKEVGNLFHLKYLCLRNTKVKKLPKSIGNLQNLQILDLFYSPILELPIEINKLRNLRLLMGIYHDRTMGLNLDAVHGLRAKKGIGCLNNLHVLCVVDSSCGGVSLIKELDNLRQLRWLSISNLTAENARALSVSIQKMNHLERLVLISSSTDEILDLQSILSPPSLLYHIVLRSGRLLSFPSWISKLQNLSTFGLNDTRLVDNPLKILGGLPNLEHFWLENTYEREELHFEKCSFPKLKLLQINKLDRLEIMKVKLGALPLLEVLCIGTCPLLKTATGLQHLRSLKLIEISDMPGEFVTDLQPDTGRQQWTVRHVPYAAWFTGEGDAYDFYQSAYNWNVDR
ncbi:NB-ARC domain, LRR domain containing protein [Trema orientale]|uniref:NB-ARC domain, LRR domain containing protein n=1 Tax=Trema orientale TaxID=63057 RepID=A0A2P5E6D3_TREOI|nr:NB-ARC domain, LRR domain containing protein [Trema orientale]